VSLFEDHSNAGCYFSNYNLADIDCSEFSLEIDYSLENKKRKLTRDFKKQKQSMLINRVVGEDYENLDAEELSYFLIVLNDLETRDSKLSEEVYDLLKNERDNANKCWPTGNCDLEETTNILKNLKIAGYDLNSRLLEDGKNYLEKNMISNENFPLSFSVQVDREYDNVTEEIECELIVDDGSIRVYTFDENATTISKEASSSVEFSCLDSVDEIIFTINNLNGNIKEKLTYEVSNFKYELEGFACLGEDGECDYESSVNGLYTYGGVIENSNLIDNYLDSLVISGSGSEEYLDTTDEIGDNGKYLYYKDVETISNYLKFAQNNDGSWGKNAKYDRIVQTSWAVLGLQKASGSSE